MCLFVFVLKYQRSTDFAGSKSLIAGPFKDINIRSFKFFTKSLVHNLCLITFIVLNPLSHDAVETGIVATILRRFPKIGNRPFRVSNFSNSSFNGRPLPSTLNSYHSLSRSSMLSSAILRCLEKCVARALISLSP